MWRKTSFEGNHDSDQSISEEEDLASDWPENCIALCGTAEKKEGIQIHSQLEVLREYGHASSADTHERDHGTATTVMSNKRQTGFSSEDEVEFPVFHDDGGFISPPKVAIMGNSEEEIISDNEENNLHSTLSITLDVHSPEREKGVGACTWSAVAKEAEALVHQTENARCSPLHAFASKENKPVKGGRGKSKSRFLFHFQSHKEDIPFPASSNLEVNMSSKFLSFPQGLKAVDNSTTENSMAELLDSYQEKTNSKMYTSMEGRRVQLVGKKSISPPGKRDMDNSVPPEDLDTESSSDDEVSPQANVQNLGLIIPESRQKAMSDKFQEAFGAASANEEGAHLALHGVELFGKLQRVLQRENKTEVDFVKKLESGAISKDESSCFDVEILSRCLEAKLTVCRCSLKRDNEDFQLAESLQMVKEDQRRTLTVIFSSRVCDAVELEVGNLICIHSPWSRGKTKSSFCRPISVRFVLDQLASHLGRKWLGLSSATRGGSKPPSVAGPNPPPAALPAVYSPALPLQPPPLPALCPPIIGTFCPPPPPPPATGYARGYRYPPVQWPPRRNRFGLSAGLVGALIGGVVIGEGCGL